jgi:predicted nucleotidyltransferase
MQFAKAIHALVDEGVEFVVIGGLSASLHGSARLTFDLDICYARDVDPLQTGCRQGKGPRRAA